MLTQSATDEKIRNSRDQRIKDFFNEYEKRFQQGLAGNADVEGSAKAFAGHFVGASPVGISGGKNDESFREAIPKGLEYYRNTGMRSMKIGSLGITPLDQFHFMVKVHWVSTYNVRGKKDMVEDIEFDVIYFLQYLAEDPVIFAYITGDEQAVLKERGLLPEQ
jgi:hypothetical protein